MKALVRSTVLLVSFLLLSLQAGAQCTSCSASCISAVRTGNWNECPVLWSPLSYTCGSGVGEWNNTGTIIMSNRNHVIPSPYTVTVPSGILDHHARTRGLYISVGGTLIINDDMSSSTTSTLSSINVCGTMTVNAGVSNFEAMNLVVSGTLNINGGSLEVNTITVRSGGIINLNGGKLLRNGKLTVEAGGIINILNSNSELTYESLFNTGRLTQLDGTIDCTNILTTNTIASKFYLGAVQVGSVSTGRIRTRTAFIPRNDEIVTSVITFFGYSSSIGGTVEYYGNSSITLDALNSRNHYYDLEVNITGAGNGLLLNNSSCTNVVGNVYLRNGNLKLNGKTLKLRGRVIYFASNYIEGNASSQLHLLGKLSSGNNSCSELSAGLTTFSISSQGATVDVRQFELLMSSAVGGAATLGTLRLNREDIVHLRSNLTVNTLDLERGILRTYSPSIINVTGTAASNLNDLHNTTGFNSLSGYVSGHLRRVITPGVAFDFPVGHPNATNYSIDAPKHRRLTLDVSAVSGSGSLTVSFVPPTADCIGSLNSMTENGFTYLSIHPEGHWNMTPDVGITSATYTAKLYVHGFTSPVLVDNMFSPLKRVTASGCSGWSIPAGSTVPSQGASGRILETSGGAQIGHSDRLSITGFSDIAIGIMDAPLPVSLLAFQARPNGTVVSTNWETQQEIATASFSLERADASGNYQTIVQLPARGSQNGWNYAYDDREPLYGTSYYRLRINDLDGRTAYGPVVAVRRVAALPSVSLLPNPTDTESEVVLEVDQAGDLEVTIYDVTGQVRYQQPATPLRAGTHRFVLNRDHLGLGNGVYILKVKLGDETRMLKWVVQ